MQASNYHSHFPSTQTFFNDMSLPPYYSIQAPGQNVSFPLPSLEAPPELVPAYTPAFGTPQEELSEANESHILRPQASQIGQVQVTPSNDVRVVGATHQQNPVTISSQGLLAAGTRGIFPGLRPSPPYLASDSARYNDNIVGGHSQYSAPVYGQTHPFQQMTYVFPQLYSNRQLQAPLPLYHTHAPVEQLQGQISFGASSVDMTANRFLVPSTTGDYPPSHQAQQGPAYHPPTEDAQSQDSSSPTEGAVQWSPGQSPDQFNGVACGIARNMAPQPEAYPLIPYAAQGNEPLPSSSSIAPVQNNSVAKANGVKPGVSTQISTTATTPRPVNLATETQAAFGISTIREQSDSPVIKQGSLGHEQGYPAICNDAILEPDSQSLREPEIGASKESQRPSSTKSAGVTRTTRKQKKTNCTPYEKRSKTRSTTEVIPKRTRGRSDKHYVWRNDELENLPSMLKTCTTEEEFISTVTPYSHGNWVHNGKLTTVGWDTTTLIIDRSRNFNPRNPWRNKTLASDREGSYPCFTCRSHLKENNSRYKHMVTVSHGAEPFVCDMCGERLSRRDSLQRHKQAVHGEGSKKKQ